MKERPILFSAEMILALLREESPKSMTRRIMKPQPRLTPSGLWAWAPPYSWLLHGTIRHESGGQTAVDEWTSKCPYGQPGSFLWVREAWWHHKECRPPFEHTGPQGCVRYEASEAAHAIEPGRWLPEWYDKKPSIFMPRWASRLTLEITAVRAERLTDITIEDAQAEGVTPLGIEGDGRRWRAAFRELWDSLNAKRGYGWNDNPFVWAITFKRVG